MGHCMIDFCCTYFLRSSTESESRSDVRPKSRVRVFIDALYNTSASQVNQQSDMTSITSCRYRSLSPSKKRSQTVGRYPSRVSDVLHSPPNDAGPCTLAHRFAFPVCEDEDLGRKSGKFRHPYSEAAMCNSRDHAVGEGDLCRPV
jgi:hypothetical protein